MNRNVLWAVLIKTGIQGRMLRMLRAMYATVQACIGGNNGLTDFFQSLQGLKQRYITSSILFSLLSNGLDNKTIRGGEHGVFFIQQNSNLSNGLDNKTIRRGEHGVFFIQQNSNCFCSCLPTNSPSPEGQWRKEKNGGNWLLNHLGCPNDPRG